MDNVEGGGNADRQAARWRASKRDATSDSHSVAIPKTRSPASVTTARNAKVDTRNLRLTAIRSLFAYESLRHPEHAALIQRVLAIPPKRFDKPIVSFFTATEIDALIDAPDRDRWEGRRDRALLRLAVQTGLRVSELTSLDCGDVSLGTGANVRCQGKGRRHRAVPLTSSTDAVLAVLAGRARRLPRRAAVPDLHRAATQPRCSRAPRA